MIQQIHELWNSLSTANALSPAALPKVKYYSTET